jgi:cytoskeleton protein RodZ
MSESSQTLEERFALIGQRLKALRESRGMTLQDISARTRINQSFLDKIEQGDMAGLPGLAFVKGFLRNYMQALDVSDAELDKALLALDPRGKAEAQQRLESPHVNVLETEPPPAPWTKIAIWTVLAVLIIWVGYMLVRSPRAPESPAPPTPAVQEPAAQTATPAPQAPPPEAPAPAGTPEAKAGSAPPEAKSRAPTTPAQAPKASGSAAPPPTPGTAGVPALDGRQKLRLTIRGLEKTWVRMSLDRAPPIDVRVEPAETVGWEANQEIRLTIGKSNAVAVYLNGEEIILPPEQNKLITNIVLNKLTLLRLEN